MQNIESLLGNKQGEETLRIIKDYLEIKEKINNEFKDYFTEVVHAEWEYFGGITPQWRCSHCHSAYGMKYKTNYCPHCGAKMDKK